MIKLISSLFLLIFGIVLGIGLNNYYPFFKLEDKINIIELATLIASVFIAVYIPVFFERFLHVKRFEKDIIVKKINELQNSIKLINKIVANNNLSNFGSQTDSPEILSNFTVISNELNTIKSLLKYCFKNKFDKDIEDINKLRFRYKNLITGGNFQKQNYSLISIEKIKEKKIYQDFDKAICLLILKINKV